MTILEMSLGGGVLIAAILVLRRALLYRVPKWTFLLLWAAALCRLVIPFAVPSPVSVYTGAAWAVQALEREEEAPPPVTVRPPAVIPAPLPEADWTVPITPTPSAPEKTESVSPIAALYLTGAALCGLFFGSAYLWALRRFWEAVPAEDPYACRWREEHPTLFPIQIKVSRAVNAPLAYGLIHPVILLPQNTDWSDRDQLTCVLTHEYVHIRRGDLLWKLLLTAALCLHWFNPLVWAMYFCANRDLELACDEAVVRILGLDSRKRYARALLAAAESGFFPLCTTYTTKNHMEERIRAVMKIKKQSLAAIFAALLLVAGVTAVFATSRAPADVSSLPQAVMTNTNHTPAPVQKDTADGVPGEEEFIWPLPQEYQTISYPFTKRVVSPVTGQVKDHPGIDITAPKETAVYAAKSGVVARSELDETYGNLVEITHSGGISTCYAHLSERSVEVGQEVKQGAAIGTVGATGTATGPVLHFGIFVDGNPVDPAEMFKATSDNRVHPVTGQPGDASLELAPENTTPEPEKSSAYPVNSKGQTYGISSIVSPEDYIPDLINVPFIKDGKNNPSVACYVRKEDAAPYRYPNKINNPDDAMDYMAWLEKQPYSVTLPAYDKEGNSLGTTEVILNDGVKVDTGGKDLEATREEVKNNRWGVPANPIPEGTEFTVPTSAEANELCDYLHDVRGIANGDLVVSRNSGNDTCTVIVAYFQTKRGEELANGYPVNSKGQTYGSALDREILGYEPDLCSVQATNGVTGYVKAHDLHYCGYPGTVEDMMVYIEWQEAQPKPITIPVYDVNYDKVVGYFAFGDGSLDPALTEGKDLEAVRDMIKNDRVHPVTGG